jgi:hypothetical protein
MVKYFADQCSLSLNSLPKWCHWYSRPEQISRALTSIAIFWRFSLVKAWKNISGKHSIIPASNSYPAPSEKCFINNANSVYHH